VIDASLLISPDRNLRWVTIRTCAVTLVESRLFLYLGEGIQMKVKKAQVTKKDVEDFIVWIKAQDASGKSADTKDYPEFTKVLEESEDKPLAWQLKKSISYRGAWNYTTGERYRCRPGESYVVIGGSEYIQNDKEALDGADPRRKSINLLFRKATKASDFYASYSSIPPKHVDFEEYPIFYIKPYLRPKSSFTVPYDVSKVFGLHEMMPASEEKANRPKVDMEALGDFKEWLGP